MRIRKILNIFISSFVLGMYICVLFPTYSFAKKVTIQWKPIEGAAKYEILIEKEDKKLFSKMIYDSEWIGDLKFGVYTYQIRAYDKVNREGVWSEPRPLVVMALKPEIIKPTKDEINLYSKQISIPFEWTSQSGVDNYEIIISQDSKTILKTEVQGTTYQFLPPNSGKFQFQVIPIMKSKTARKLASVNKQWSGTSAPFTFNVEHKQLEIPKIKYPIGVINNHSKNNITLKWESVEGAEKYLIKLYKGRTPAGTSEKTMNFETKENSIDVPVDKTKKYWFDVQPVANLDSSNKEGAIGPKSTAQFSFDNKSDFPDRSGYLALSWLYSPYTYKVKSQADQIEGGKQSTAYTYRLSSEYFPWTHWGLGAAVQMTTFQVGSKQYDNTDFEMIGRYRIKFGDSKLSWFFYPKAGFESRSYTELVATIDTTNTNLSVTSTSAYKIRTVGPQVGFDLRKQLTSKFSLGMKFAYFKPLFLMQSDAQSLNGDKNDRNLSVGLQTSYWINKSWGLAAGGFYDQRSLSFLRITKTGAQSSDSVKMDATYYFISLIYLFGL